MHDGVRPTIDLCDPEFYRSAGMHDAFTWMRANEPVYRDEENGLWAVTRHADLLDVERRSDVFVSGSFDGGTTWPVEQKAEGAERCTCWSSR